MILPDINLLLYAYNAVMPQHEKARQWWESALNGTESIGLPHEIPLGFVRIATNPRLQSAAVSLQEAVNVVTTWFKSPLVTVLLPETDHAERVFQLLEQCGGSGILTSDASLAVYAMRHRATIYSNDADFARFPGLQCRNPLKPH